MISDVVMPMGRTRGRPPKPEDESVRAIKLHSDLVEMISWIVKLKGGSAATLVGPLIRAQIEARYEQVKPQVEKIKRAQAEVKKDGE